jgi:hypothetical protein
MWHFYWRLIKRTPVLLWHALTGLDKITGALVLALGAVGVSAWQQLLPWWSPFVAFGVILLYGFLRENYEEYRAIERERDKLRDEKETEDQRAALKEVLAEAMREGQKLLRSSPSVEQAQEWVTKIRNLLLLAFLDTGEAELFLSDDGLPPLDYNEPLQRVVQTDEQKWIRRRLQRLANLIQRADSLKIRPGFNGRDHIVPD